MSLSNCTLNRNCSEVKIGTELWSGRGRERERERERERDFTAAEKEACKTYLYSSKFFAYLSVFRRIQMLIDKAQIVMEQWVLWTSPQSSGVVGHCLFPSLLDATQVTHVGVGIDVVCLDGQRLTVGILCFFGTIWYVCAYNCVYCRYTCVRRSWRWCHTRSGCW